MDKSSHLSNSSSTTDNLDPSSTLSAQDDHLLQVDSTSLSSQDTSGLEIEFVPGSEGQLVNGNITPTDAFLEYHDYELFLSIKRLVHHLAISAIRKVMIGKSDAMMTPIHSCQRP